jgi:hypothetical protein
VFITSRLINGTEYRPLSYDPQGVCCSAPRPGFWLRFALPAPSVTPDAQECHPGLDPGSIFSLLQIGFVLHALFARRSQPLRGWLYAGIGQGSHSAHRIAVGYDGLGALCESPSPRHCEPASGEAIPPRSPNLALFAQNRGSLIFGFLRECCLGDVPSSLAARPGGTCDPTADSGRLVRGTRPRVPARRMGQTRASAATNIVPGASSPIEGCPESPVGWWGGKTNGGQVLN